LWEFVQPAGILQAFVSNGLPGDPQVAALLSSAAYDDCLLGYETDPGKADTLRRQGQLEALKGTMLTVMQAPNAQSAISIY
jgi:hypothetical protein